MHSFIIMWAYEPGFVTRNVYVLNRRVHLTTRLYNIQSPIKKLVQEVTQCQPELQVVPSPYLQSCPL